jgi:hypothetical protein
MDERDYQFMNNELNQNNMEITLDKTKLSYVRRQDRIQGNWYIVLADVKSSTPWIVQWHSGDRSMDAWGTESVKFNFWFEIPPNLPGFPQSDLPDLIKLPLNEWSYSYSDTHIVLHKTKRLPSLTIPSGTKAEQIEAVRKLLNELQTKPNE